ncbi:MAG TPA: SufD family Fe-S cluster assembly protein [Acidimicrobiales bacterium]|nr:SufD family Fe-S cluster assembly protein [Acidimicrobiales bacterium]
MEAAREEAAARYAATPLPTSSLEEWRYSRIDSLDLERYPRLVERPADDADHPDLDKMLAAVGSTSAVIETLDGFLVRAGGHSAISVTPAAELPEAPEPIAADTDAFAIANRAFAPDPIVIRVASGTTTAEPVVVLHRVTADESSLYPRVRVEAGEDSEITVLEVVAGPGRSLVAPVTEIDVARAARVSYLHLQMLGTEAWQIALQASRVAADARLVSAAVALGGDYARLRTDSALVGPGGSSRLLALYFGAGEQMHDFRTVQDHRVAKTTSDLLYKGAVANTARSVYSGLIRVEKGARGTNAFQTNRNLVLHEGAHADSVPNLEIEDNDVRCSHASAVGPVSDDERFYLESRGVPPEVTDRLITLGFLGEVIDQLPVPSLGPTLAGALADKLTEAETIEESRS